LRQVQPEHHIPSSHQHTTIMKLLILAAIAMAVTGDPIMDKYYAGQFSSFIKKFDKSYSTSSEAKYRMEVFTANMKMMREHNNLPGVSYQMGVNQFSDLTKEEFRSIYLGGYKQTPTPPTPNPARSTKTIKDLPESVDWRDKGACTPVKDQGQCGSCWAFATTAVIESHVQIATSTLPVLSTQQVTSCTPNPLKCGGTGGCYGSIPQLGYTYIQLFGQISEDDYPYVSGSSTQTEDCEYNLDNLTPVAGLSGYNILEPNSVEAVMDFVANQGPLAVAVAASDWGWYSGGVFDGCSYDDNIALNHAVVLVGYGTDETEGDYWIVRNSWGPGWGENGHIRLKRESTAMCGVNSTPMDGTACVGGPGNDQQTVCGMCGVLYDVSYPLGAHLINN
jgi:cathepsin L